MSVEIVLESTLVSGDHSRPLPEIQQAVQFKLKPFSADNARATTCLTCYTDNAAPLDLLSRGSADEAAQRDQLLYRREYGIYAWGGIGEPAGRKPGLGRPVERQLDG